MKTIFINPNDGRIRAGWRLLIQAVLFFILMFILQAGVGIVGAIVAVASGIPATDAQNMIDFLTNNPLLMALTYLSSLAAIWASYLIIGRWIDRRPVRDYGFRLSRQWWADFGFGLFLGAILMVLIFLVELSQGWVTVTGTFVSNSGNFTGGIIGAVILFIAVGFYEEMWSRGYQIRNLAEGLNGGPFNARAAVLISFTLTSAFFGLLHASNPNANLISTVNIMIAGLFLGLGYLLTRELAIPIGLHITWNFFQGNVFGFPVSGTTHDATFIGIQQGGPVLWTGGDFGPEAGLIGLLAIVLGCLLTVAYVRLTRGSVRVQDELAIYQPAQPTAAVSPSFPEGTPVKL